ncbi:MAG: tautomerase family protein [Alphaproteobacteria bacterium]|nr:tautomerase family protein [Alphaproteobacteria bacterium]
MPYIEAKMSIKLDERQKDDLQKKLTGAVSAAFGKPKAYIMTCIEDDKSLYMAEKKLGGWHFALHRLVDQGIYI